MTEFKLELLPFTRGHFSLRHDPHSPMTMDIYGTIHSIVRFNGRLLNLLGDSALCCRVTKVWTQSGQVIDLSEKAPDVLINSENLISFSEIVDQT